MVTVLSPGMMIEPLNSQLVDLMVPCVVAASDAAMPVCHDVQAAPVKVPSAARVVLHLMTWLFPVPVGAVSKAKKFHTPAIEHAALAAGAIETKVKPATAAWMTNLPL